MLATAVPLLAGAGAAGPDRLPMAADAPVDARERELLDRQRAVQGRIRSLDRQLAPYDRDRLRAPPPDQPDGRVRDGRRDPLAERRALERRSLQDRERLIDQDLRQRP